MKKLCTKTYCADCLAKMGVKLNSKRIQRLQSRGRFPKMIAHNTWDAAEIDRWFLKEYGNYPPVLYCKRYWPTHARTKTFTNKC